MVRSATWRVSVFVASAMFAFPLTDAVHLARLSERLPDPPGRLVDIGGQRIHLDCTGSGSPTVVFENGAGDFSMVWSLVQPGALVALRRPLVSPPIDTAALESPLDRMPRHLQDVWRVASADSVHRLTWAAEMDWSRARRPSARPRDTLA